MLNNGEDHYTIVKASGEVVRIGTGGVVILGEDGKPAIRVSEVSDDNTINLFISPVGEMIKSQHSEDCWEVLKYRD